MNVRSYEMSARRVRLATALLMIATLSASAFAQKTQQVATNALDVTRPSTSITAKTTPDETILSSLSTLPEADTLTYASPQRLLNDALPKVLSETDVKGVRFGIDELKKQTGIDIAGVEYVVAAIRFNKPSADLNFSAPQFLVVAGGDFSSEAVMVLVRMALDGKLHDEPYAGKTISLVTIDEMAKALADNPLTKSFSDLAIAPLNGNTIAAGSVAYVKAAIDAMAGKGRVDPQLLKSLLRDPNALASFAGSPLTAFAKSFGLLGTETTPRTPKCDTRLGDYYLGVTMDGAAFKVRGAMNADNPDTAKIFKSLVSMLLDEVKKYAKDPSAQAVLNALTITPTETEVVVSADIAQQQVADFIKELNAPKKQAVTTETAPAKKLPLHHRRRHRVTQ